MSSRAELSLETRGRARRKLSDATLRAVRRLVARAMRAAGVAERALALSFSDDDELLALNRQYADEDHATDVLSFEQGALAADIPGVPPIRGGRALLLGDVIISVETAARQATAAGHSLTAELVHLSVHGLVHLMGFDHATKAEETLMFGYEARLRAAARAQGPIARVRAPQKLGAPSSKAGSKPKKTKRPAKARSRRG